MVTWKLEDMSNEQRMAITTDNETPGRNSITKRNRLPTLGRSTAHKEGMVNIIGPLYCRIIRRFSGRSRKYDDDNFSKQLRDALAAACGLKGDSKEDGIEFEYRQERAEVTETVIEIFSKKEVKTDEAKM